MTKKSLLPLAALLAATLLVAVLVGVLALALETEEDVLEREITLVSRGPDRQPFLLPEVSESAGDIAATLPPPAPIDAPVLPIGPKMIIGRVLDELTGAPITAFQITILPHSSEPALERMLRAEINPVPVRATSGIFRFKRDRGRWDVVVIAPGYEPYVLNDVSVPRTDGTPTDIRLSHGLSLTGLVHDQHNLPVVDARVFLKVTQLFDDVAPPKRLIAKTDQHGRFRFSPLPAGEYSLTVLEPDNPTDRVSGILVEGGTTDITVFLAPRHQLIVSVQDSYGRPVRGAMVQATSPGQHASGRTSLSGQVLLNWLQDGIYAVTVSRAGYRTEHGEVLLAGGQGDMVRWFTLRAEDGR